MKIENDSWASRETTVNFYENCCLDSTSNLLYEKKRDFFHRLPHFKLNIDYVNMLWSNLSHTHTRSPGILSEMKLLCPFVHAVVRHNKSSTEALTLSASKKRYICCKTNLEVWWTLSGNLLFMIFHRMLKSFPSVCWDTRMSDFDRFRVEKSHIKCRFFISRTYHPWNRLLKKSRKKNYATPTVCRYVDAAENHSR